MAPTIPSFDSLTLDPSGPPGNAWGLFGAGNELGMLNLLTPELVRKTAAEEIREGIRISLDLPLNRLSHPSFGRKPFTQELVNKAPRIVNDDILTFNTQTSTQWDGFRHYGSYLVVPSAMVSVLMEVIYDRESDARMLLQWALVR
jgi:hypothetical protein